MDSKGTFGEFIRELRLAKRITLRTFAATIGWDAANYSKLERSIIPAPKDAARLHGILYALGLEQGTERWNEAVRLAALSHGSLPPKIIANSQLMAQLPAFFRKLESGVDETYLDELIAAIRRE